MAHGLQSGERFECSEVLFEEEKGVPALVEKILPKSPALRQELLSNLVIVGGPSSMPGFDRRLKKAIAGDVIASPNAKNRKKPRESLSWAGCAIYAGWARQRALLDFSGGVQRCMRPLH